MANPTVMELQAQVQALTERLEAEPKSRIADIGAEELAEHIYSRIPGLRVENLGGPTITAPARVEYPDGSSMVMTLRTPDGRLYQIEVYLQGAVP